MSKRKKYNNKDDNHNFPFNNEISLAKHHFKQMIDEMPDDVFAEFCLSLEAYFGIGDEEWIQEQWAIDEGWEDDAEAFYKHYNNSSENSTLFDDDTLPF